MNTEIKQKVHFVHPYLLHPTNPISVNVYGGGGTGSHLVDGLRNINYALNNLGHAGLQLKLFDSDQVENPNFARTTFNQHELGINKAVALVNRANRFSGTNWKAIPENYDLKYVRHHAGSHHANIHISCVDDVQARLEIEKILEAKLKAAQPHHRDLPMYWLDYGNSRYTGQFMLSTVGEIRQPASAKFEPVGRLLSITQEYPDLLLSSEKSDALPSCSLAEALESQDLFINDILAKTGASMIWNMLTKGILVDRGAFFNIENFRMEPIPIS